MPWAEQVSHAAGLLVSRTSVGNSGLVLYGVVGVIGIASLAVGACRQLSKDQAAADSLLASGIAGTAQILSADWTGAVINLEYVCRIGLTVQTSELGPYDAHIELRVDPVRLGAMQPGATVAVRVDRSNPQNVLIDFDQPILPPGQSASATPTSAAELAEAYRQNADATQTASATDLLASGQRVRGVLKS